MSLSLENFDAISNVPAEWCTYNTVKGKSCHQGTSEDESIQLFSMIPERKHKSFGNMKTRYLSKYDLKNWMIDHYSTVHHQNHNMYFVIILYYCVVNNV